MIGYDYLCLQNFKDGLQKDFEWEIYREPEPEPVEKETEADETIEVDGFVEDEVTTNNDDGGMSGGAIALLVMFILGLIAGASTFVYCYKTNPVDTKACLMHLKCSKPCCKRLLLKCRRKKNSVDVESDQSDIVGINQKQKLHPSNAGFSED